MYLHPPGKFKIYNLTVGPSGKLKSQIQNLQYENRTCTLSCGQIFKTDIKKNKIEYYTVGGKI